MDHPFLRYGSVCSGIEAASLAWRPLGWRPAWFAEIDPFPNAVLAHHYPDVPNLGDMTRIADQVLAGTVPAPDLLVGGTPCQAFSVAGLRQGLEDPRGALALRFTELADAIDRTRRTAREEPAIIVWENVPGVLSDKANAFGCLLGALAGECGAIEPSGSRWTHAGCVSGPRRRIAWRVLDAQYFGVAQRRRRVFLVASGRDGFDPAEVLFEPDSLQGHPAPGRQAAQIAAGTSEDGADHPGLFAGGWHPPDDNATATVCFGGGNTSGPIGTAACLTARGHKCDFEVETFAAQSLAGNITHTLNAANGGKGCSEDGSGRGVPIISYRAPADSGPIAFAQNSRGEVRLESGHGQIAGTLSRGGGKPGYGLPAIACDPGQHDRTGKTGPDTAHGAMPAIEEYFEGRLLSERESGWSVWSGWRVRRLTPVECERLQGMPDNYTLVPYRGKPAADAPRYKAIGNAMAVPCVEWLGRRIAVALRPSQAL
ncbi:DNA cytosine methyltransferase [Xanthobacter autotrophicus]|uniref:DNA cytosine methyltransferase n=1 Tax=Xanthobacter autotrophicus TaxID=280 RepID=UPI003727B96C